jgi:hypothetical protein
VCYSTVAVESRRTPRQGVTALHSGARSDGICLKTDHREVDDFCCQLHAAVQENHSAG